MSYNFYSDDNGYHVKQLSIESGTISKEVVFNGFKMGKHTVTAAEVTATKTVINTGITIAGQIVSIVRSNLQLSGAKVTFATTNLTIESNGSTYVLTAGDVINYIVW
jgi:hypothetical protein